jgi:DNA-binding NtrC family response regulator
MPTQGRFLLVSGSKDSTWQDLLRTSLAPFGSLDVEAEGIPASRIAERGYEIVFVDATDVGDVLQLIIRLRACIPEIRVIVATASPTWLMARAAFQAGATDYIAKSLNRSEILSSVQAALRGAR